MKRSSSLLPRTRRERGIRTSVQALLFVGAITLPVGIFHMICPMGGIATLTRLISQGLFIPKTGIENIILLLAVLITTIVAGPVFCGWICPLGSIQDWANALARRTRIPQIQVKKSLDRVLQYTKYLVLALILFATAKSFNLVFIKTDPYYALMHFYTGEVAPLALTILGATLLASLFLQRPWCRYLCPLGAILSLLGKFSILKVKRPSDACISCGACSKACPVSLDPGKEEYVTESHCIRCGLCESSCPPKLRTSRHTYSRSLIIALGLTVLFFLAPLLTSQGNTLLQVQKSITMQTRLNELEPITGKSTEEILTLLGLPSDYEMTMRLVDIEDDYEDKNWQWIEGTLTDLQRIFSEE
ncbi:MAG TPA: 4Fe-4S binding protein [Sphaerochaeta sp.]|nr:4Fe-4S binding protein [Sphaerochaeta sp.]